MTHLTLDAGALIGLDRNNRRVALLLDRARAQGQRVAVPAGALGQAWRDGARQARLARLLRQGDVDVIPLDDAAARAAGQLCGSTGTTDVVDASVALCARTRGGRVATSDPEDLRRLDPGLRVGVV